MASDTSAVVPTELGSNELVRRWSGGHRSIPDRPRLVFVRVDLHPVPGVGDHGFEVWIFGFPTKLGPYPLTRGYDDRRVPRTPGRLHDLYAPPRYPAGRFYNLGDREARTVAEVIDPLLALLGCFERQKVGAPEVLDVYKVAHSRAVPRRIVRQDLNCIPPARGHLEGRRDGLGAGGSALPKRPLAPATLKWRKLTAARPWAAAT